MPEPTPTTDVASEVKQKKLPKWAYIAIIGGGVVALVWYKNKKKKEEESTATFQPATTGGQTSEPIQELPGGLAGSAAELQRTNNAFLEKFLESEENQKKANEEGTNVTAKKPITKQGGRGSEVTGTKGSTAMERGENLGQQEPFENPPTPAQIKEKVEKAEKEKVTLPRKQNERVAGSQELKTGKPRKQNEPVSR